MITRAWDICASVQLDSKVLIVKQESICAALIRAKTQAHVFHLRQALIIAIVCPTFQEIIVKLRLE